MGGFDYTDSLAEVPSDFPTAAFVPVELRNEIPNGEAVDETFTGPVVGASGRRLYCLSQVPREDPGIEFTDDDLTVDLDVIPWGDTPASGQIAVNFEDGTVEIAAAQEGNAITASYTGKGSAYFTHHLNRVQERIKTLETWLRATRPAPFVAVVVHLGDANLVTESGKRMGYFRLPAPGTGTGWQVAAVTIWSQTQLSFLAATGNTTVQVAGASDFSGTTVAVTMASGETEKASEGLSALPKTGAGEWWARFTAAGGHGAVVLQVLFKVV